MIESEPIALDRLPKGFAERVSDPPDPPPEPRPAATIVLMRTGAGGPEVLLLGRSRKAGFVPGAYVFPGGRVDDVDADPDLLERIEGLERAGAAARLGLGAGASPEAHAYFVAALREAFEETGLLIGADPARLPEDGGRRARAMRHALLGDEVSFAEVLDELGVEMEITGVEYIAHWVTPVAEPRRYDTRFFAAVVPAGSNVEVDDREIVHAVWERPGAALQAHRRGELPMIFPTLHTLRELADFTSAEAAIASYGARAIPRFLPRLVHRPGGIATVID